MPKSDKRHRVRARKDITIRLDLYEWGQSLIEDGEFWNWSHLVEQAILRLKRVMTKSQRTSESADKSATPT